MQTSPRQSIGIIAIIIVVAAGLVIFIWNFLHGRDLSKPPQFDLSAYDNPPSLKEIGEYLNKPYQPLEKQLEAKKGTLSEEGAAASTKVESPKDGIKVAR